LTTVRAALVPLYRRAELIDRIKRRSSACVIDGDMREAPTLQHIQKLDEIRRSFRRSKAVIGFDS
jgi:hypothetical protein